jgi:hypothetical protein
MRTSAALWRVSLTLLCLAGAFIADAAVGGMSDANKFVRPKECGGCPSEGDMELDCKAVVTDCLEKEEKRKQAVKDKMGAGLPNQTCIDAYLDLACYPAYCCSSKETSEFRALINTLNINGCVDKINPIHATVAWKHVSHCSPSKENYCVGDSACDCAYPKDYVSEVPDCCCSEEFMPQRGCIGSEVKESKRKCAEGGECDCKDGTVYYVQKYKGDKDPADGEESADQVEFDDIVNFGPRKKQGSTTCSKSQFGDDPAPNRKKVCFCHISSDGVLPNCCNKADTWKTHWCRTAQMCPDGEGEDAKDLCPRECKSTSTSIVGEWSNGYCQALSDDYDPKDYYSLMDQRGRDKHAGSSKTAIKSVKFVCLNTARNYEAFGSESDDLRSYFKAEDASMGIFLYEEENCNAQAISDDVYSGVARWEDGAEKYFMRLVLPATACVSGTSFITCKYDAEMAALAGDNEGLSDYSAGLKSLPCVNLIAALVTLVYAHLM